MRIPDVPVLILCGGLGTRLKEMTEFRPKPMIPPRPRSDPLPHYEILWKLWLQEICLVFGVQK
jgi:glucose-1-phosphate cytidylyltransferase